MRDNNNRLGIPAGRPLRGGPGGGSPPGYHPTILVTIPVSAAPLSEGDSGPNLGKAGTIVYVYTIEG